MYRSALLSETQCDGIILLRGKITAIMLCCKTLDNRLRRAELSMGRLTIKPHRLEMLGPPCGGHIVRVGLRQVCTQAIGDKEDSYSRGINFGVRSYRDSAVTLALLIGLDNTTPYMRERKLRHGVLGRERGSSTPTRAKKVKSSLQNKYSVSSSRHTS